MSAVPNSYLDDLTPSKRINGRNGVGAPAVTSVEVADFLAMKLPPRVNLLAPILPRQGVIMVHGPRGLGKTHLSLNIAYALASGSQFLRWQAPTPVGVLLVDGEMPARTLQERLARIAASTDTEATAPLRIITPDLNIERGMPNLSEIEGQAAINEHVREDIQVIIVDNLSCLLRSGVENDSESWLPVQTWALAHRAAGRSVVFIHHSGKGGAQRGTSRREDTLDTVIGLRKPSDYSPDQGARFEIHFEKSRGFYGDDAKPFEAHLQADSGKAQVWKMTDLDAGREASIGTMSDDGMKPNDIAHELGISRATVYRKLKQRSESPPTDK